LLLAHPDINVNVRSHAGQTPFSKGCSLGHVSVVEVVLKDPRVDVLLDDNNGCTPLWWASFNGHHEVIEWLVASGRDLGDTKNKKGKWIGKDHTALAIARMFKMTEVVTVLERFIIINPAQTRHEVRVKLGVLDELAAEVFGLVVFLCDDILYLNPASNPAATHNPAAFGAATRFFAMASKLPMELQMMVCHRAVGSMKQNILRKDSEVAFKSLARILLLLSQVQ